MPIQLDKILADIALEKVLHPNYPDATKKEMDDAWGRVGKNNKLSVHEARSIFKVLQKKYEQEKVKGTSAWKLYLIMEEIHSKKIEVKPALVKQEDVLEMPMEEDEEYEMLEVQEEEEHAAQTLPPSSTGSASDSESPVKSNSSSSPEKDEKPFIKVHATKSTTASPINAAASSAEEKKLLNTLAPSALRHSHTPLAAAAALHKKGITLKKAQTTPVGTRSSTSIVSPANVQAHVKAAAAAASQQRLLEVGKTIQLPESIKRKLSEERSPTTTPATSQITKKINLGQSNNSQQNVKQERDEQTTTANTAAHHGISLITIPANMSNGPATAAAKTSTATVNVASSTSTSTNGFSPRIEDIDFKNDIIFDATGTTAGHNGGNSLAPAVGAVVTHRNATNDVINMGNFDNALPPTFFKNLCNSSRYEALGLYVANVMNRLRPRSAAKLELGILRAITDVQSDDLEH